MLWTGWSWTPPGRYTSRQLQLSIIIWIPPIYINGFQKRVHVSLFQLVSTASPKLSWDLEVKAACREAREQARGCLQL